MVTDKEAIRKEIRKMRHTRDSLVQQRQELDERQHRVYFIEGIMALKNVGKRSH